MTRVRRASVWRDTRPMCIHRLLAFFACVIARSHFPDAAASRARRTVRIIELPRPHFTRSARLAAAPILLHAARRLRAPASALHADGQPLVAVGRGFLASRAGRLAPLARLGSTEDELAETTLAYAHGRDGTRARGGVSNRWRELPHRRIEWRPRNNDVAAPATPPRLRPRPTDAPRSLRRPCCGRLRRRPAGNARRGRRSVPP